MGGLKIEGLLYTHELVHANAVLCLIGVLLAEWLGHWTQVMKCERSWASAMPSIGFLVPRDPEQDSCSNCALVYSGVNE